MAQRPTKSGEPWTAADVTRLRQFSQGNTPTRLIALKLKRTEQAVRSRAALEGVSLRPWNQRPYGTPGPTMFGMRVRRGSSKLGRRRAWERRGT
jgi:hypothetical protein